MNNSLIVVEDQDGNFSLAVHDKGVSSAEMFAVGRYFMYSAVYFNHTARAFDRMLQEILLLANNNEKIGRTNYENVKDFSDEKFIDYFIDRCEEKYPRHNRHLCDGIKFRRPYKRLVVLSEDDTTKWLTRASNNLLKNARSKRRYEKDIIDWLKDENIATYNRGELLIDLPEERTQEIHIPIVKKSGKPLEVTNQLWKSITENFNVTVRKLRVFVSEKPPINKWTDEVEARCEKAIKNILTGY